MEPIFDHEKLDVYRLELQFVAWTTVFLQEVSQSPVSHRCELLDQLDRASRMVAKLTRLVGRFDPDEFRIREDGINA
jgi:hypothetical protein